MSLNVWTCELLPQRKSSFSTSFIIKLKSSVFDSLARATLVLIPLLGIHEVVFTVLVDECVEGSSRYARNFINLTLSSFQVAARESCLHMIGP